MISVLIWYILIFVSSDYRLRFLELYIMILIYKRMKMVFLNMLI